MSVITIDETPVEITLGPIEVTVAISSTEAEIAITNDGPEITVATTETTLTIGEMVVATVIGSAEVQIVTVAQQGPQGIAGNSDGATTVYVYGETISALVPVVIIAGQAYKADSSTSNHRGRVCGITETAANAGDSGTVRYLGPMTDASWNWSTAMVFVGPTGTLVGTPPSGFSQPIARVETPTTLFINPLSLTERA